MHAYLNSLIHHSMCDADAQLRNGLDAYLMSDGVLHFLNAWAWRLGLCACM